MVKSFQNLFLFFILLAAFPSFSQNLRFEKTIKGVAGPENFNTPSDVKVDPDGKIYIVTNNKIKIFSNSGSFIREIGIPLPENVSFSNLNMAIDANRNVYVVDRQLDSNDSIKVFDSSGNLLLKFPTLVTGENNSSISNIAIHPNGAIYIADGQNHTIKVFNSDGEFIRKTDIGFYINGMTLDSNGQIYIAHSSGISIYSDTGSLIKDISLEQIDDGLTPSYIGGISVAFNGNIYVGDSYNYRVLVFNNNGDYIRQLGSKGGGDGQFSNSISSLTVDQNENAYVVDYWRSDIQVFNNSGIFVKKMGSWPVFQPIGLAVANDKLFISDYSQNPLNPKFLFYKTDGSFLKSQGSYGDGDGQFQAFIVGVVVIPNNNIYVIDQGNNRVQIFNANGEFISSFGSEGTDDGQFSSPFGITADKDNNIYVADLFNNRIQVFTSNGTFLRKFGTSGTGDGQFNGPTGIALDEAGNIYASDTRNHRVQVFTNSGTYLRQFGSFGTGDGQFNMTEGLKVDKNGIIYVVDRKNHRIQVFNNDGTFISKFGSLGSRNDQLNNPWDIALDEEGKLYVADAFNNRIQVLSLKPFSEVSFSIPPATYGETFDLVATSSGSGAVSYAIVADDNNTAEIVLSGIGNKNGVAVKPGIIKLRAIVEEDGSYSKTFKEATLTINKAHLNVKVNNANKLYGDPDPDFSFSLSGLVNNETEEVIDVLPSINATPAQNSNAGIYSITASNGSDDHYDFDYVNGEYTIAKASLTVTAQNASKNYGTANPIYKIDYNGFKNNETPEVLDTPPVITSVGSSADAGSYPIIPSGGEDNNYTFVYVSGSLDILKADQVITMNEIPDQLNTASPFEVNASATSGLPITFSISSGSTLASITNSTISLTKEIGEVTVEAKQTGNGNYNAAAPVSRKFNITRDPVLGLGDSYKELFIGPNPATDLLITAPDREKITRVEVIDLMGRLVREESAYPPSSQFNLQHEDSLQGLLIVKVYTNLRVVSSKILFRKAN